MTAAGQEGGGPPGPERDERVTLPPTERLGRKAPESVLAAILLAAAFLVGVIRPWDWLAPGQASPAWTPPSLTSPSLTSPGSIAVEAGPADPPAGATPRPGVGSGAPVGGAGAGAGGSTAAPTPALAPVVEPTCAYPRSWRLAAIQDWGGRMARVWTATDAVAADGPGDPAIPFTTVASTTVTAVGWCAPVGGPERPPLTATGTLFRLDASGPRQMAFDRLEPAAPDALGELWMPVPQSVGRRPSWPPGRYVIRLAAPGGTFERYLGIEVVRVVREGTSPSPAAP